MINFLLSAIKHVPAVIPHLKGRARWLAITPASYKSFDYFLNTVERLVRSVYTGHIGGEFVDLMGSLISGQMRDAYEQAWEDDGNTTQLPDFLQASLDQMIIDQANFDWVLQYYHDIIDAKVDETPIDPLLARAGMWANRWNEANNTAKLVIAKETGGKLEWVEGDTEDKCPVCLALNGIVAYARDWEELDVQPERGPNWALSNDPLGCKGWKCECELKPTDKRKTANARDKIMEAVNNG